MSRRDVEDVYRLSPLQEGMLFESLRTPGAGLYVLQMTVDLVGRLDRDALRTAWQVVMARHPVLRSSFHWRELDRPHQVVHRRIEPPWHEEDLRPLDPADRAARAEALAARDRNLLGGGGDQLERAPLLALCLLRLADDRWRFQWSAHHLLLDGWSQPIVVGEVFAAYRALAAGRPAAEAAAELPPVPPFRRFVDWLLSRDRQAAETFWRGELEGVAPTPLPGEAGRGPGPPDGSSAGSRPRGRRGRLVRRLPAAASAELARIARDRRTTIATLLQLAWGVALSRWSGAPDVVFGAVVAGRPAELPAAGRMVGPFINTVPVRLAPAPGVPWGELLDRLQARRLAAGPHEWAPLADIQRWGSGGRFAGRPLVESLVVYESYPLAGERAGPVPELAIEPIAAREASGVPLALASMPGDRLELVLAHDPERVAPPLAARCLAELATLLRAMAEVGPAVPAGRLPLLDRAARHQLLVEWSDPTGDRTAGSPVPVPVPVRVAEAARRAPDAVAVEAPGATLTFGGLRRRTLALARRLRGAGAGPERVVGVCLGPSPELLVAAAAVLEAGAVYLPLDPALPPARLAELLADAAAVAVVAAPEPAGRPPLPSLPLLDAAAAPPEDDEPAGPPPSPGPPAGAQAAYRVYTSGSTGRPKGVTVSHRAFAGYLEWVERTYPLGSGDGVLVRTTVGFDPSLREIFWPLVAGARALPLAGPAAPDRLRQAIAERRATVASVVPSLLAALLEGGGGGAALAGLRWLIVGGEALPPALQERALAALSASERGGGAQLVHHYGPAEATINATAGRPRPGSDVTLGRPLAGLRAWVASVGGEPAPIGAPGELLLAGPGLARGYAGRPAATAERFRPDPRGDGERLYRTGDRASWTAEGELRFLGRLDLQVKVRGVRVEPGEVEAVLAAHPAVEEAAVVARGAGEARHLVAFFVSPADLDPEALRDPLAARLPSALVPSRFVRLDRLPRTPAGKVDRTALEELETAGTGGSAVAAAGAAGAAGWRSPIEEQVAAIWARVLDLPGAAAAVDADFFAAGGHSLAALRLVARLREALGIDVPVGAVFDDRTPRALARRVEAELRGGEGGAPPPLVPRAELGADDRALPLAPAQERLWFLHRLDPASAAYHLPLAVRLRGRLDLAALAGALGAVARRHEVLRTRFPAPGGRPVQVVDPPRPVPLPAVSLERLAADPARATAVATALVADAARRPFDLAAGPPWRALLVRRGADDHLLLVLQHHVVTDEQSAALLLGELVGHYRAAVAGRPAGQPPLAVQYADYALWQRRRLTGETLDRLLGWWRERLAGAPEATALPLDRPRPPVPSGRGGRVPLAVAPAAAASFEALAREHAATRFQVVLAAVAAQLHRYGAGTDLVLGVPVAGRSHPALDRLLGFFVNTLPLRLDLAGDPSFGELVGRVREAALGAFAHGELPLERLVEALGGERRGSGPFGVLVALHTVPRPALDLPGLALEPVPLAPAGAKAELVYELGPDLAGGLEHSADLFDRTSALRMAGHLERLLEAAVAAPDRRLSALPLLGRAEHHQATLEEAPARSFPVAERLEEALLRVAAERPDAVAVVEGGSRPVVQQTYAALARRAAALAAVLGERGVRAGEVVGLAVGRTADLVVGMLGVLAAGAAYLPLDPDHPPARRALALADAGVRRVVVGRGGDPAGLGELDVVDLPSGGKELDPARPPGAGIGRRRGDIDRDLYVLFTSGSTGRPKGVPVTHRAVGRLLAAAAAAGVIEAAPAVPPTGSLVHSPAFDFSVWELWTPLAAGGRLVLVPREVARSADDLVALLARERVTLLAQTPSAFAALERAEERAAGAYERSAGGALPDLERVIFGGEALDVAAARRWRARHGDRPRLIDMYGITETTVHVTHRRLVDADLEPAASALGTRIGRPLPDLSIRLLDATGRPVPLGVPGEIHVGGAGLTAGYLGRPRLTAERFVPDPWPADAGGGRLYRSGDLARRSPDGSLAYLGRLDAQVQVRGHRVEPGEVAAALLEHPGLVAAAVVPDVRSTAEGGPLLVAYLVAAPDRSPPGAGELLGHLRERLPEPMVPGRFVFLDELPRTASGKLDRRALPAPGGGRPELERPYEPPATPLEEVLAGGWAEALGVERVGRHDSFFDLGGHSLLATRVAAWVREVFEVELPLKELFARPTVAATARALTADPATAARVEETAELVLETAALSDDEVAAALEGGDGG